MPADWTAAFLDNKPFLLNLGAVFACVLCLLISLKPDAGEIYVMNTNKSVHTAGLTEMADGLSELAGASNMEVMVQDGSVRLRMYTGGMFRVSRAELSREAQKSLKALSGRLRVYMPEHIRIEGYVSDERTNTPQYPNNWYLSSARAIAVGMFLIHETGFSPKRITAEGHGAFEPLSVLDEDKNNRIEIVVTP